MVTEKKSSLHLYCIEQSKRQKRTANPEPSRKLYWRPVLALPSAVRTQSACSS